METVKICAQRAVHMCWHFETSPQEFLAVCYKNWSLCAERLRAAKDSGISRRNGKAAFTGRALEATTLHQVMEEYSCQPVLAHSSDRKGVGMMWLICHIHSHGCRDLESAALIPCSLSSACHPHPGLHSDPHMSHRSNFSVSAVCSSSTKQAQAAMWQEIN